MSGSSVPLGALDLLDPLHPTSFPTLRPLLLQLASLWTPPARLPLSTWSEQNIVLSSEYAARSSALRLFGWQREIFDTFTDPAVEETVLFCGTQLVKTLFMQCAIAYIACEDPGPILLVQPKEEDAKAFSRERLEPMQRDCSCLRNRISDSRLEGNLLLTKSFPGGSLSIISARVPGNLARRSIRYLLADEIDKYPATVGSGDNKEGDPLDLARERQVTFGSRKKRILACSPTVKGLSRIGKAYDVSDQRRPYVPCPVCGQYQLLDFFRGVKWDNSLPPSRRPATAYYQCAHCPARWTDPDRWAACDRAQWRADRPFAGVAGFWISHLYSPWKKLSDIVAHFLTAKDDRQSYQVFVNTVLAQPWEEAGQTPSHQRLYDERAQYPFGDDPAAVVPARALFLTAFVDVQDSPPRLEVEVKAWGRGMESWSLDYRSIQCYAPQTDEEIRRGDAPQLLPVTARPVWDELDAFVLNRVWAHETGPHPLSIWAIGIDTGNRPKPVYEYARRHSQGSYDPGVGFRIRSPRTVIPTKGTPDPLKLISSISKEDAIRKRQGVRIVGIGTHCAKQQIYDALQHVHPRQDGTLSGVPTPGCYHYPMYDMPFFLGLTAETRVVSDNGKVEWEKRYPRNEPLDLAVGNRAVAALAGIDRFREEQWRALEEAVGVGTETGTSTPTESIHDPVSSPAPVKIAGPPAPVQLRPVPPASPPRYRGVSRGSFL